MAKLFLSLLLVALLQVCGGYKILVVFPSAGKSHNILGMGYVKHLLDAGHEVTYATPFPTHKTTDKYHEVDLSKNIAYFEEQTSTMLSLKAIINKETSMDLLSMAPKFVEMMKGMLVNEDLSKFLSDTTQEFDVVIAEWLFTDVFAGIAPLYNCPLIWSSSVEAHWMVLQLVHEPSNPSFNPNILASTIPPFSFFERFVNLFTMVAFTAAKYFYIQPNTVATYNDFFKPLYEKRGRQLPAYEEAVYNGTFMLTNSHTALSQPISVPPNVREIGGYHINPNPKPLPANLQKIMDEAKHGVIYFSMGTNAKSKDWPDSLKKEFLQLFSGLKQTVLWKFEEQLPNLPKNVHILNWAPQQSILAHPNIRLFITHGGLLSTTETVFFGVPTIVMPYGADQRINALRAVNKGYAKLVDLSYEMAADMKVAIEEVLSNPKYSEKVKELSQIYHDRPVSPGAELVHWVEHVVRTRGAPHLRSPALMLPWYQKMYLDLAVLILVILYVIKVVMKLLFRKVFRKAPITKKKTN
ncbi:UDP-glucosyltransferase 2-like [Leguminivora glycinivorella]|uniref:UDP-glucosyltransferase 2-like n=1 Tax=Leguminivora glycinivorella TaxID=1035111 RepID=UPI00200F1C63|nr:UDP-glucosyltransferase 2-like [Leguminivora glycinivorella]XP_047991008.1 UDP-glucosyltransferase 2-like [Leguminivora glycinivorella]XP_047991014.1 UDP-glucosyltransferase 2-like [Leguminivora glycinivorella]XP_047991023.1 UDP-glucosyltransferase 2-like [Leguminivora glycinivorella]